ncbi:MAG: SUMF1/EgtB/PvdO family nonheme iron enzyme [Phycisphaeraceae bacterium]
MPDQPDNLSPQPPEPADQGSQPTAGPEDLGQGASPSNTPTVDTPPSSATPTSDDPLTAAMPGMSIVPEEQPAGEGIVGTVISNKYKVLATIGQGGMGVVVKALDLQLQREVTIKRLNDVALRSRTGIDRFFREARSVAALNHRNIVSIYELGSDEQGPYIVMEFLSGGDLEKKIAEKEKFSLEETLAILKPVAKGLAYAHSKGIVHRDVKPSNIILDADATPKIVDFGIARRDDALDLSLTGQGIGTPAYMAPEQRSDSKRVDQRSDIFALAKTAYQMITGEMPDTIYFDQLDPAIRPAFEHALQKDPDKRQPTMDEFIAELDILAPAQGTATNVTTSTTSAMVCTSCDAFNKIDARFCRNCGAGMFEDCPSCSVENHVGTKFCLACGISIEKYHQAEESVRKARGFLEQADFDEAVAIARQGKDSGYLHAELDAIESEASEKRTEIARLRSTIDQAFKAKKYREAGLAARQALELAPASRELRLVLSKIQQALYRSELELAQNNANLALERKRYPEAAKAWQRLVRIDAEHPQANKIRQQIKQQEEDHRRRYQEATADRKAGRMASAMTGIRSLRADFDWDRNIQIDAEAWEALEAKLAPIRTEAQSLEDSDKPKLALAQWNKALQILSNDAESLEAVQRTTTAWAEQKTHNRQRRTRNLTIAAAVLAVAAGAPAGLYVYEQSVTASTNRAITEAQTSVEEGQTAQALEQLTAARASSSHPLSLVPAWKGDRDQRLAQATYLAMLSHASANLSIDQLDASRQRYAEALSFANDHNLTEPAGLAAVDGLIQYATRLAGDQRFDDATAVVNTAGNLLNDPNLVADIGDQIARIAKARESARQAADQFATTRRAINDPEGYLPYVESGSAALAKANQAQTLIDQAESGDRPLEDRPALFNDATSSYAQAQDLLQGVNSEITRATEQRAPTQQAVNDATKLWQTAAAATGAADAAPGLVQLGNALAQQANAATSDDQRNYPRATTLANNLRTTADAVADLAYAGQAMDQAQLPALAALSSTMSRLNDTFSETGDFFADFGGPTWDTLKQHRSTINAISHDLEQLFVNLNNQALSHTPSSETLPVFIDTLPDQVAAIEDKAQQHVARWTSINDLLPLAATEAAAVRLADGKRNTLGMTFVALQGGDVAMGHATRRPDPAAGISDTELRRSGRVDRTILVSRFEVTRGQYEAFLRDQLTRQGVTGPDQNQAVADALPWKRPPLISVEGQTFNQTDRHPVVFVSATEATDFCTWLTQREGITYRLPTEAEWEYAARANADPEAPFHWGDRVTGRAAANGIAIGDSPTRYQWEAEDAHLFTAEIGTGVEPYPPNNWGLYNLHGNVAEWATADDNTPIVKGGSWACSVFDSRLGDRRTPPPNTQLEMLGFRVVIELPEAAQLPTRLYKDQ